MADDAINTYEIWEQREAPNRGADHNIVKAFGFPYDEDWETWSYCIGNGYTGANLFGGVDTERIQITGKAIHNQGCFGFGGLTNFAELFIDLNHGKVKNYRRSLNLDDAIARVSYQKDGITFEREYFMSYPDRIMAIKLTADKPGSLSFDVRPKIAYVVKRSNRSKENDDKRTALYNASSDTITASGTLQFFSLNYELQVKVIPTGGTLKASATKSQGKVQVKGADSAVILIATGTNYKLSPEVFLSQPAEKLDASVTPHEEVSAGINAAAAKGYDALREAHVNDYQTLFSRVSINLNSSTSKLPTSELLEHYKKGTHNTYLEELMFQYGRYLLIASSRPGSLPANLQGAWNNYYYAPWSGGYWHNINVQMNYWGAMSANLAETFDAYTDYFKAYLPKATSIADDYVRKTNPDKASKTDGENGWVIGTDASPYHIGVPGGHSGPGTGGFTSKLLMEYYLFTADKTYLKTVAYPALLGMSTFFSRALVPDENGILLVSPSASPEQMASEDQLQGMPGHRLGYGHYLTKGCTFDQGFVWENHNDTLIAARELGITDPILDVISEQIKRLDPIQVGESGQIKEYREETTYSSIGDPKHRHISHLCPLYPGTLINWQHPEWMKAAECVLDMRGNETTGWALAHRMNCRARLKQGEAARDVFSSFLSKRTTPNLWTMHPPFQVDGNLGSMAAVVEMLLQSHAGVIEPLPALPKAWANGHYDGLVARGNFVVSAKWKDSKLTHLSLTSRAGQPCKIKYPGLAAVDVKTADGTLAVVKAQNTDLIEFPTQKGETYTITF